MEPPYYLNPAEPDKSLNNIVNSEIKQKLELDRWNEIKVRYNKLNKSWGEITYLRLMPYKNIEAIIEYEGELLTKDIVKKDGMSYPLENPLFNSKLIQKQEAGRYWFRTNYPKSRTCAKLKIKDYTNEIIELRKRQVHKQIIDKILDKESIGNTLVNLVNFILNHYEQGYREKHFWNFSELYEEFRKTNKIRGDCKAVSTFTAGLLNAIGIESRCISCCINSATPMEIDVGTRKFKTYTWGHQFAEAYFRGDNDKNAWMPVDAAMRYCLSFPVKTKVTLTNIPLPEFRGSSAKARIKISYV